MSPVMHARIVAAAFFALVPLAAHSQGSNGVVAIGGETLFTVRTAGDAPSVRQRVSAVEGRLPAILGLEGLRPSDVAVQSAGGGTYRILVRNRLLITATPEDGRANGVSARQQADNWAMAARRVLPQVSARTNPRSMGGNLRSIRGTATYRQRITLPYGSVLVVRLLDVSRADAPAVTVVEERAPVTRQVPIPFQVRFAPAQIDQRHTYVLDARLESGGRVRWIPAERPRVLTQGSPADNVTIMMTPLTSSR